MDEYLDGAANTFKGWAAWLGDGISSIFSDDGTAQPTAPALRQPAPVAHPAKGALIAGAVGVAVAYILFARK